MTLDELKALAGSAVHQELADLAERIGRRGDGIAVYRNELLGDPNLGHLQFVSFGSRAAQIETAVPPQTLPDIGGGINWRYQLIGTWKES